MVNRIRCDVLYSCSICWPFYFCSFRFCWYLSPGRYAVPLSRLVAHPRHSTTSHAASRLAPRLRDNWAWVHRSSHRRTFIDCLQPPRTACVGRLRNFLLCCGWYYELFLTLHVNQLYAAGRHLRGCGGMWNKGRFTLTRGDVLRPDGQGARNHGHLEELIKYIICKCFYHRKW